LDETTLEVELEGPTGYFLHLLPHLYPLPRHAVQKHGDAWASPANVVTNGPFQLYCWQPNQSMRLARDPHSHLQGSGNVETVEISLTEDRQTLLEMYDTDERPADPPGNV
jgi:oligopeptide transport system substrate-binding protein